MNEIDVFVRYAAAFEVAYASDDWSAVRDFFTDDAVYEVEASPPFGGTWKGRNVIVDHLIESVNAFDRTYDERALEILSPPTTKDGAVHVRWGGVYRKAGQDDLRVEGEEYAWIRDGKIARLKDIMP
ncbi:MAG: nuclear transport factor 2 family protein [Candidatus Binatia bacterium]